jgi:putative inorganic carbon (hco3(-)) transporter
MRIPHQGERLNLPQSPIPAGKRRGVGAQRGALPLNIARPRGEKPERAGPAVNVARRGQRWDLAFLGVLAYLIIEYARVPAMFPILQPLNLGKVAVGICALGWFGSPKIRSANASEARPIDFALWSLMFVVFFSTLFARYQSLAWQGLIDALTWAVIYFVVSRIVASSWRLKVFLTLYFLLFLKLALFVIRSYVTARAVYGGVVPAVEGVGAGSQGFFANGSDFGVAMCVAWPLAGTLLFMRPKGLLRILLWACVFVFLGALLVCGSRGAVVGGAAIALAALWRSPKKLAAGFMILLFLAGIYFILPKESVDRLDSATDYQQDETANHRILLWKAGLQMFADHPLLGVGPANFPLVRRNSYHIDDPKNDRYATLPLNTFMDGLTELGALGFLLLCVLWVLYFRLNRLTREHLLAAGVGKQSFEYCLAQGLDLAMIGYLISGITQSVLWFPHMWFLLAVSVGLHTAATQRPANAKAVAGWDRSVGMVPRRREA